MSNGRPTDNLAKTRNTLENMMGLSNDGSANGVSNVSGLPLSNPVISYFCQNENKSCLDGLSQDEKFSFMNIVQKQFNKGIKVVINYSELAL